MGTVTGSPALRAGATCAAGLGLAGVLWAVYSGPFPLDEFCTRNRPTWVFGLFDRPRYTALSGAMFLASLAALTGLYLGALWLAPRVANRTLSVALLAGLPLIFVGVLLAVAEIMSAADRLAVGKEQHPRPSGLRRAPACGNHGTQRHGLPRIRPANKLF